MFQSKYQEIRVLALAYIRYLVCSAHSKSIFILFNFIYLFIINWYSIFVFRTVWLCLLRQAFLMVEADLSAGDRDRSRPTILRAEAAEGHRTGLYSVITLWTSL